MTTQIELHDSRVTVNGAGDAVVVRLCPAYVHHWSHDPAGWRGNGCAQAAEILIEGGSVAAPPADGVFEISDGWIQVGEAIYRNMIPAPLTERVPIRGMLELVNADPIEFAGVGISVRLVGDSRFIERLPDEWAPTEGSG